MFEFEGINCIAFSQHYTYIIFHFHHKPYLQTPLIMLIIKHIKAVLNN